MNRPKHQMLAFSGAHEREAHERRLTDIEASCAVMVQKRLKPPLPLSFRESAPIELLDGYLDSIDHVLHGFRDSLPAETRAQNRMSLRHPLPGAKEPRFIQRLVERRDDLLDVDSRVCPAGGVEEQPRLHR